MQLHAVTVAAALLLLSSAACAQTFDADAAVGIEIDEANLVEPGAENVDADEASGIDPAAPGPAVELLRQDLVTVGPFIRTCPCTRVRNLVRALPVIANAPVARMKSWRLVHVFTCALCGAPGDDSFRR